MTEEKEQTPIEESDMQETPERDPGEEAGDAQPEDEPTTPQPAVGFMSDRSFHDFPLSPELLKGLDELGYATATPVQAAAVEPALAGKDLLVRAKTGTGKTAAFGLPMIERIPAGSRQVGALVLTPTRELALQVANEMAGIGKYKDLRISTLYGGVAIGPQTQALKDGVEIVVGTPGRIIDHIRRGNLDLSTCSMACLDEADEMLGMGFLEEVVFILDRLTGKPQVLLFSATVDDRVGQIIRKYMSEPESIMLSTDTDHVEGIRHVLYETEPSVHKARSLLAVVDKEAPSSAIIFTNTREDTSTVASFLARHGLDVEMISGSLPQNKREQVMARLKAGDLQFLVATDVAARGIDISDLSHVIHYSLPEDPAVYLHRSGRTGRLGKEGRSVALAGGMDLATRTILEKKYQIRFDVQKLPSQEEASALRLEHQARLLRNAAGTTAFEGYLPTVRALRDHPEGERLLAVALRAFFLLERQKRVGTDTTQVGAGAAERSSYNEPPQRRGSGGRPRGRRRPPRR